MYKTHTVAHESRSIAHKIGTAFLGVGYAAFLLISLGVTLLWVALRLGILALVVAALLSVFGLV